MSRRTEAYHKYLTGGYLYPSIAQQRQQWVSEIDSNPKLKEFAAAAMSQEAGDDDAYLGAVESLFNRTQMRKSKISRELTNGFYGPVNRKEVDAIVRRGVEPWMLEKFDKAMDAVRNGSDLIEGRTDQGMINEIIGPKAKYGSEYFGYMGGDPTWSIQHQRNKGEPGNASRAWARAQGEMQGRQAAPGLPEGMVLDEEQPQGGLPPGMKLDEEAPVSPAVPSRQLPSGEMAPLESGGQEGAAAAKLLGAEGPSETIKAPEKPLPELSPSVARTLGLEKWIDQDSKREVRRAHLAGEFKPEPEIVRQKAATASRAKLISTIEGLEKEGYTVPHTMGKPNEPEGDRAPTKDMETVVATLKRKQAYEARTGQFEKSKETGKQAEEWAKKVATEGMSVEQEAAAGKEPSLGINTRIAQEPGVAIDVAKQESLQKKADGLNEKRTKLVQTFTPDQPEKAQEIQKLDDEILAIRKEIVDLPKTKEKDLTPEQLRDVVTGKVSRKEGMKYAQSVAASAGQAFEKSSLSILTGTQALQEAATRKLVNPYKDAATAKTVLPELERQLAIFKEGASRTDLPANVQEAYVQHASELERKIGFAKARMEGKSGEGLGAKMHAQAKERATELTEKVMPAAEKKWDKVIDQVNKDDTIHTIAKDVAGSLPSTGIMMATGPVSMPVAATAGFIAIASQTYNDALKEGKDKGLDQETNHQQALIKMMVNTPMEEIGDITGAKMFVKALAFMPKNLKPADQAKWFVKTWNNVKAASKEVGPTLVAEGHESPIQCSHLSMIM